jgi:hypothetical protein
MTASSRNLDPTIVLHRPDLHIAILPEADPLARGRNLTDVGQRVSTPPIDGTISLRITTLYRRRLGATKLFGGHAVSDRSATTSCNGGVVEGFSCPPNRSGSAASGAHRYTSAPIVRCNRLILLQAPSRAPSTTEGTLGSGQLPSKGESLMRFYNVSHNYYCGIDLHARQMYTCVLDRD